MAKKAVVIIFILIGMAYAAMQIIEENENEYKFADNVVVVKPKDCEGTQWIKQQECSINGKSMDGTEGSCGPGKEIWILDPNHSDFKQAEGGGKCEPEKRDCSVECPKPCEGDTWKDTGRCVRREYDTRGNMKEIVLDGTEGKCGEGITELNLDTTAPDYKPAVGKGECPMTKGGACNVPCPKPEPPKCNNYTGWVENVGLGCVVNKFSKRKVQCGTKGVKQFYNVSTNPQHCEELVKWEDCWGKPCPIDCVGSWSGWGDPKSDEPCGVQPYKQKTYSITTQAQHGGTRCDYAHNDIRTMNAGSITPCCIQHGQWIERPGTCTSDGIGTYDQTVTENKTGGCSDSVKTKEMECCYQGGDWTDITKCNSVGRKTQQQTTAGNCDPSLKTRDVDCEYIGEWYKSGGCGTNGKQQWSRTTVNSDKKSSETRDCCYEGPWKKAKINTVFIKNKDEALIDKDASGNAVNSNSWYYSRNPNHWKKYRLETREIKNCPAGHPTERKLYKCGRGACRQYDKYWFWSSQDNINTAGTGSSVGSNCKNKYNCCERWEECSEESNDYIKGPKGTQGNYQYSY